MVLILEVKAPRFVEQLLLGLVLVPRVPMVRVRFFGPFVVLLQSREVVLAWLVSDKRLALRLTQLVQVAHTSA